MYLSKEDGHEDRKAVAITMPSGCIKQSIKLQFAIAVISTTTSHSNVTIIFSITLQKLAIA